MVIQWVVLCVLCCFIAVSYIRHYPFKMRIMPIVICLIASLIMIIPVFSFSILTLLGLFLFEKLWIILASVLFVEALTRKNNRMLSIILGCISVIIYSFLRTII